MKTKTVSRKAAKAPRGLKGLFRRIRRHANVANSSHYNFWNFFSAFVVPEKNHLGEVEGILIAATRTENRANPRIRRIKLPAEVARVLKEWRQIDAEDAES